MYVVVSELNTWGRAFVRPMLRQILPGSNRWTYTVFIPYKRDGSTSGGLDI